MEKEQELKQEVQTIEAQSNIIVADKETYEVATGMVITLKEMRKKIVSYWKLPKDAAFAAHREIIKKESEMFSPVDARIKDLDNKVNKFLTEERRAREEAQRKLDESRRKQEAEERAKLEARAAKAEAAGKDDKAEALREKAAEVYVAPAIIEPTVDKTTRTDAGTVTAKTDIEIEIVNPMTIIKHIAAGLLPIGIVTISDAKLKAAIKLMAVDKMDGLIIREVSKAQYRGK
jgi:hypothetical protein